MTKNKDRADSAKTNWLCAALRLAAVYNVLWGVWVVLLPNQLFDWNGIERPNHPWLWQCIGMIVGVYGIGYWIAASNYIQHWPIVLVGFLGKLFGPIGFVLNAMTGAVPWTWGAIILGNDVIWWVPFGAILYAAFRHHSHPNANPLVMNTESSALHKDQADRADELSFEEACRQAITSDGRSLWDACYASKLMVVFLRHAGCTFCREALSELKQQLPALEKRGIVPVVVHMGSRSEGDAMLGRFGLESVMHVSNPKSELYRAFHLQRGNVSQLLGPRVWWRGFKAAILDGHGFGMLAGDGFQLGGTFILENGKITESFPAKNAADPIPFECVLE
ncbi:MAG: SelL-related redox protein [Pirellula sp.]